MRRRKRILFFFLVIETWIFFCNWNPLNFDNAVPVWSAVSVMGVKLKDINKEIGTERDPEAWNEIHEKVIGCTDQLLEKKSYSNWGVGICVGEIVDAIVRNTCICITVSAFVKVNNYLWTNFYKCLREKMFRKLMGVPENSREILPPSYMCSYIGGTIHLNHPRAPIYALWDRWNIFFTWQHTSYFFFPFFFLPSGKNENLLLQNIALKKVVEYFFKAI